MIGHDTDGARVDRALRGGMQAGTPDSATLARVVLEHTAGQGADQTILTAGTKSNEAVNLAMVSLGAKVRWSSSATSVSGWSVPPFTARRSTS